MSAIQFALAVIMKYKVYPAAGQVSSLSEIRPGPSRRPKHEERRNKLSCI